MNRDKSPPERPASEERRSDARLRPYSPPELVAWGTIHQLTAGDIFGGQDADMISGTGGT